MSDDSNKKRKAEAPGEEEPAVDQGVPGIPTDDGVAWDLGGNKLLRVKTFKGNTYVDIREFYEDKTSGEKKPGKKGIALNVGQWGKFLDSLGNIKEAVEEVDASK